MNPDATKNLRHCRHGAYTLFAYDENHLEYFSAQLLPDPELVFSTGEPVSSGRKGNLTARSKVDFVDRTCFMKRYNDMGGRYGWKYAFRPSKAMRSMIVGHRFQQLGFPTPTPLCVVEERFFRRLKRSYVLFPHVVNAVNLLEGWTSFSITQKEIILGDLAELVGKMHARGICHGDLNWRNILIDHSAGDFQYYFVDLDGLYYNKRKNKGVHHDLRHFIRDFERTGTDPKLSEIFLRRWQDVVGI